MNKNQPIDLTLCIIHKLKKTFFCEDCLFELCVTCKERHEKSHPVKLIEESSQGVIDSFKERKELIDQRRIKVKDALNIDPT